MDYLVPTKKHPHSLSHCLGYNPSPTPFNQHKTFYCKNDEVPLKYQLCFWRHHHINVSTMTSHDKRRRVSSDDVPRTQRTVSVPDSFPPVTTSRLCHRGRNRKGFLEQSQLTEKDRRHVRYKERELLQSIKENATDLAKLSSETFDTHTQELDEMYEQVCYPREANLDASNLDELNVAVAKQSQALGSSDLTKVEWLFCGELILKLYRVLFRG